MTELTEKQNGKTIKALSIRQPWAWAIMEGHKDIENRDWSTNIRGRVAIHASKGMTGAEYDVFTSVWDDIYYESLSEVPSPDDLIRGHILGTVEIVDCVDRSASPWFFGKYGFVLKDPRKLAQPIPYRGQLGFFDIPSDLVEGK